MGTGRIPLWRFYSSNELFGESEEYLRDQGVLDYETSGEPQVIIPNYIQAASNCIVATPEYHVCCPNPCEDLLREIEVGLGVAEATEAHILAVVGDMIDSTTLDGRYRKVDGLLRSRLAEVAAMHGGMVRLHGRLFSQWLHYAFPHECRFPRKLGSVSTASALEYSGVVGLDPNDVDQIVFELTSNNTLPATLSPGDWMSQWDDDEELLAGYMQVSIFPSRKMSAAGVFVLFSCLLLLGHFRDTPTPVWTGQV